MSMEIFGIGGIVLVILGLALVGLYFLPTIIAIKRGHPSKAAIIILNTLLGWSFLGWVVSLVWSFSDTRRS